MSPGGSLISADTAASYPPNNWYNVICTYSTSTGLVIYVNGISAGTNGTTGTLTTSTKELWVGRYSEATGYGFNGTIDELAMWNRVLTQAEITQIYGVGVGVFY
jgi:MSHA biogenesis protein MshQ